MKDIKFSDRLYRQQFSVELHLRDKITIISGECGAGRSFIRQLCERQPDFITLQGTNVVELQDILESNNGIPYKNKIILVDDIELLVQKVPNIVEAINNDWDNYYILFMLKDISNIRSTPNSYSRIIFNENESTFSLQHEFRERILA